MVEAIKMILLAGSIQGVLLAAYLLYYSKTKGSSIYGALLILLSIHLFLVVNDTQEFFLSYPHLLHITWILPAFYGPLLILFIRRITGHSIQLQGKELLFFLPAVFLTLFHLDFFLLTSTTKQAYLADFATSVKDDFGLINQIVTWLHVCYFSIGLYYFQRYQLYVDNNHSSVEYRISWLGQLIRLSLLISVISIFVFYSRKFEVPYLSSIYPYHFLGILFLIYWSAFKLIKQPEIFQNHEVSIEPTSKSIDDDKRSDLNSQLAQSIEQLMQKEKLYLQQGLSLNELAERLDTNRTYVSDAINQVFGKNFYDYINEYRLKEFNDRYVQDENKHLKILALAYDSGFNSKATFNAAFKKHYGQTPSHFHKEENLQQEV